MAHSNNDVPTSARKTKIMIVEDEPIVALDLSWQLQQLGYDVCATEESGKAAIAAAHAHAPDIVLMDIILKGEMDGIEAAKHIVRGLQIPVIFLTAFSDTLTVSRAAQVAPHGYLTKPFQAKELGAIIEVALYKSVLERNLRESELWFASTLRCVGDCVIATDPAGSIRFMNQAAERMTGWTLEEAKDKPLEVIFCLRSAKSRHPLPTFISRVLIDNCVLDLEFGTLLEARNGKQIPIDNTAAPIRNQLGQVLGAVIVFRDVTARIEAEKVLSESEKRFRDTFEFAPIGMAIVSLKGRFLQVNSALCSLLEFTTEELLSKNDRELGRENENEEERKLLLQLLSGVSASVQFEKRFYSKSGREIFAHVSVSLLREFTTPVCYLCQIHDLTEQRATQYQLAQLAHYDPLTGLANRTRLRIEIEHLLRQAKREKQQLAVVFLDLDHFKEINDTLGHEAGDILLKIMAERLRQTVRDSDCVARLGGDEFVLILPVVRSVENVTIVIEKIRSTVLSPVDINGHEAEVGISIGVSMYPIDGDEPAELFRCADSALYHAKAEGRNNVQFYREELTARMEQRVAITNALKRALERNELELYYQPIVPASQVRKVVAAEALLRWNHPQQGLIMPADFISIAEATGLIVPIGTWVIAAACREAAWWHRAGLPLCISVNVSPRQFVMPDFISHVTQVLSDEKLPPYLLCVEITEQFLMQDRERHMAAVKELKLLGVKIAVDDFGIGYSQLSYLRRFAPDVLKIDRSFIEDVTTSEDERVIVKAVLAMARNLGVKVIAEGVETKEQHAFLAEESCDFLQGFLFSRPLPLLDFREFILASAHGNQVQRV